MKLRDFCELYPNKRVNICFQNTSIPINDLEKLSQYCQNFYVRLLPTQIKEMFILKDKGIKYFFDVSMPCYSGAVLDFLIKAEVTDIYLYDSLWYALPQVAERCKAHNVGIRLILNRIPSLRPDAGNDYCAPIFSPIDMDYLSKYVDTGEFDCYIGDENEAYDWHKFNVYYKAWYVNKKWLGYLNELNIELQLPIPVPSLPPNFINRRCECGRRCSLGGKCTHCQDYIELANNLHNQNIYFK